MRIHRFIIPGGNLQKGAGLHIDDRRVVYQAGRVLRLKANDIIAVCNGYHQEARVRIEFIDQKHIRGDIEKVDMLQHDLRETVLYCSVIKKDNFEMAVQKATEAGASEIVPLITARVVKTGVRLDRLRLIALEASEQSGRGTVPKIYEPYNFDEAVKHAKENNKQNILFDAGGEKLNPAALPAEKAGIFIGPEGGWSKEEVNMAQKKGCQIASLGTLILRAETAATIASYVVACRS